MFEVMLAIGAAWSAGFIFGSIPDERWWPVGFMLSMLLINIYLVVSGAVV